MRRETAWTVLLAAGAIAWLAGTALHAAPLRWFGAAVGIGLAPGLAAARALDRGERFWLQVSRALFLGPLLSGCAATVLLALGLSARAAAAALLAGGMLAGFLALAWGRGAAVTAPASRWERRLLLWLLLLAVLVLLPHALRPWVRMRSDAVFHTAVSLEIAARGVPPGDPYFAGLPLNYIWFYHALLAVWSEAAGVAAWDLGGLLNAFWFVSLGGAVYALSRRAGRPGREAFFAALFVPMGLDALFYLGFAVKLLRAFTGETAGAEELRRLFSLRPFTLEQTWFFTSLSGSPPAFLNKYLVMTALGGAVAALAWLGEGLVAWARDRRGPVRRFAWVAATAFALWMWHPGVAGAATLGTALAGVLLLIRPGPVPRRLVSWGAAAFACGSALAAPLLMHSVARAEGPFPIGWSPAWPGILIGSTAALLLGLPALLRLPAMRGARVFQALAAGMMIGALWTVLPPPNTGDKMSLVFYLFPAVAAGWTLARWWRALRRRGRGALAWILLLALCLPINGLYLAAYLFEKGPEPLSKDERDLYGWLAERAPGEAVVLDSQERADVLVLALHPARL